MDYRGDGFESNRFSEKSMMTQRDGPPKVYEEII